MNGIPKGEELSTVDILLNEVAALNKCLSPVKRVDHIVVIQFFFGVQITIECCLHRFTVMTKAADAEFG